MEYAVYKGEDILCIGTAEECAAHLGIKVESLKWYSTPTGQRRTANRKKPDKCLVVSKLDDE